jgi:hypothetical protein
MFIRPRHATRTGGWPSLPIWSRSTLGPPHIAERVTLCIPLLFALVASGACSSVLTKPQVDAIHVFAVASSSYPQVPGRLLQTYADLHAEREVFAAATARATDAPASLQHLHDAVTLEEAIRAQVSELEKALDILTEYSSALELLSSDTVLADLDSTALTFGNSVDTAITSYNGLPSEQANPLPKFGSEAATAARALGGIWIRHRQAHYLHEFVTKAVPTLQRLLPRITALVSSLYDPVHKQGSLTVEVGRVDEAFATYFPYQGTGTTLHLADVQIFFLWLRSEQDAEKLAVSTLHATETLAAAHRALAASLSPGVDTTALIATLHALLTEIKAGSSVGQKVSSASTT